MRSEMAVFSGISAILYLAWVVNRCRFFRVRECPPAPQRFVDNGTNVMGKKLSNV